MINCTVQVYSYENYQITPRTNLVEYDLVPNFRSLVMLFATEKRLQLADTNQRKRVSMTQNNLEPSALTLTNIAWQRGEQKKSIRILRSEQPLPVVTPVK